MKLEFWKKVKEKLSEKKDEDKQKNYLLKREVRKIKKEADKNFKKRMRDKEEERKNPKKDEVDHFVYENANAQSWNPETHPEGRGDSYVVKAIHYKASTKELIVEYRWGDIAKYENIDKDFVKRFNAADSKGRFAMKNLYNKKYKSV